jgi:hypothetical protein
VRLLPVLLTTILVPAIGCAQGAKRPTASASAPRPLGCAPLAPLDSAGLIRNVSVLAADSMGGRAIGSPGNAKSRDFLAAWFDAIGLATLDSGRIQKVPVTSKSERLKSVQWGANVVGVVRGSLRPDRYIVVTAHYDHVGIGRAVNGDSIYNGADDNASGAAALVTLAQYFFRNPPSHSVVFAAVDGEESGMWGSRAFVSSPAVPLEQILLNVNLDMIGRNVNNELYAAGPGKYPLLAPMLQATAACAPLRLTIGHDRGVDGPGNDWTGQSDQASFHSKGIPFVYFGVEDHPDYHRPSDHADKLMPAFYVAAVQTVADFIRRFDAAPVNARIGVSGR